MKSDTQPMSINMNSNIPQFNCGMLHSTTHDKPKIMGVINLTTNSFNTIGKYQSINDAVAYALALIEQGADIIDVGAEATNPGTDPVTNLKQELAMLVPFITALRKESNIPISVDTSKAEVMKAVVHAGADLINDVRALRLPQALETVAALDIPVCLMHMEYPDGMPEIKTPIDNIVTHGSDFLLARVQACLDAGIKKQHIILDPGIGAGSFGKSAQQNLQLIKNTSHFIKLGYPILMGVSFKTYIGEILGLPVNQRSSASLASALYCVQQGVQIIRVHEVEKMKQAIDIMHCITHVEEA